VDRKLIIGTRGSELALWQANYIKDRLAEKGIASELKIIKTQGDNIQHLRLDKLEGKGFFTKELEEELLSEKIDIAVHSHKDLPTVNPPGLIIAAVSDREDPSELLLILKESVDLAQKFNVKEDAVVGTSSNRRKSQLLSFRPDLRIKDLRGNVNTRIRKLRARDYDAIMIAKAGVKRIDIDLSDLHVEEISPVEFIPAPAQGVLAVQIRQTDQELFQALQSIHNKEVAEAIGVERKVLNLFEGGCHMPLGSYCRFEDGKYQVWTSKANEGGDFPDRLFVSADKTEGLAEFILDKFNKDRKLPKSVFISRELTEDSYFYKAISKHKITLDARSLIKINPVLDELDASLTADVDWVFFSSRNGIEHFFKLNPLVSEKIKFAVVGRGSEETLKKYVKADYSGEEEGIDMVKVGKEFAEIAKGQTVLFPRAKGSLLTIRKELTEDTQVIDLPIYETIAIENVPKSNADVLVFTSPSNVRAYFDQHSLDAGQRVISIGYSTGEALQEFGVEYSLPHSPDEIGLAEAVFGLN
jgi:hydroxymethylbilane synthase